MNSLLLNFSDNKNSYAQSQVNVYQFKDVYIFVLENKTKNTVFTFRGHIDIPLFIPYFLYLVLKQILWMQGMQHSKL